MNSVCIDKEQLQSMLNGLYKIEENKFNAGKSSGEACDMLNLVRQLLEMME